MDEPEWEPLEESTRNVPKAGTYFPSLTIFVSVSIGKMDEARKRREEKKAARQKELEARRASRSAGPLKLGAKKV